MDIEKETAILQGYYRDVDQSTRVQDGCFIVDGNAVARIADIFSDDATYYRQEVDYRGKQALSEFFGKTRALCGAHAPASMEALDALPEAMRIDVATLGDPKEYKAILVKGHFSGLHYRSEMQGNERRVISPEKATQAELHFDDYWVFKDGAVIYRQSNVFPVRAKDTAIDTEHVRWR